MTDRNLFPPGEDGVYDLGRVRYWDDGGYAHEHPWRGLNLRPVDEPVDMPDPVFEDYLVTVEVRVMATDLPEAVGLALEFLSEGDVPDAVRVERIGA